MLDKIIIGLLLLVLPVGIFMSRKLDQNGTPNQIDEQAIAKVDQLLSQINQAVQTKPEPVAPAFTISSVQLATESATVKVAGIAPKNNAQVMVSAVIVQTDTELSPKDASKSASVQEASQSAVLGQSVEVLAIPVRPDSIFMFDYPVDEEDMENIKRLEIRLEQGVSSTTILYNPTTKQFEQI